MKLGGRISGAIEVLKDMEQRKRPASEALRDWGLSHRFAGSGDRAAIGNLVYDTLRKRASLGFHMENDKPRALVLALLVQEWDESVQSLSELFDTDKFAPDALNEKEIANLGKAISTDMPKHIAANIPEWLIPSFETNFADELVTEGQALAKRPPLDLRVNTLKQNREKVLRSLAKFNPSETVISPVGIRIRAGLRDSRTPNVQNSEGYQKGWFEIQDEGSQVVSQLVFARKGEQVLDFCAGAGGKSLALAAEMENRGQIFAFDADRSRLAPIYERLKRAGARNVQVRNPDNGDLDSLIGKMDRVLVDAPCTGTGTWRRRPDAKWRLTKEQLEKRLTEQEEVLSQAAEYVRPGGYLVYVTCSVLPEENEGQIYAFMEENPGYKLVSAGEVWQDIYGFDKPTPWSADMNSITLTPASTDTDGFFFSVLEKQTGPQS